MKLKNVSMKKIMYAFVFLAVINGCNNTDNDQLSPPNILWVTAEDITTMLGCYGDENAHTPHLDKFAEMSLLYNNAFATAPVCSPSRSCIISGLYANTLGSQHLRSHVEVPEIVKAYPMYLRKAGYYTSNNDKEDYNFTDTTIWDESSKNAHWRNRDEGQPFFSIFNLGLSHQSSIFGNDSVYHGRVGKFLPMVKQANPDSIQLLPYYPDTPEIRKLWARYYTNVSIIDYQFSQILAELKEDGLAENTIVFFYADHGTGMPRAKRAAYDSGLKIPLLVHIPEKYVEAFNFVPGQTDRLVSFIDFAPTVLELAGMEIPEHWQGAPFLSRKDIADNEFVFGASDRVDEAFELTRTIRSKNYRYVRNFLPHLPLLQPNFYTDQSEIMQALNQARATMQLNEAQQTLFTDPRKPEELYDVEKDPHELYNLAGDPAYQEILLDMREQLKTEVLRIHDTGFMPEPEMARLAAGSTPYQVAHDPETFPLPAILSACDLMLPGEMDKELLMQRLNWPNGFVRYWATVAVEVSGVMDQEIEQQLRKMLQDELATVQVEAAKVLMKSGETDAIATIVKHMQSGDEVLVLFASRALQEVSHLLPELPQEVYQVYEQIVQDTANGTQWHKYYKLYTFWSLSEVLGKEISI